MSDFIRPQVSVEEISDSLARINVEPLERGAAGVGQRNLAPVRCGLRQCGVGLLLHHRGGEAGLRQGDGQRQARRAGADDENVAVRGHGKNNAMAEPAIVGGRASAGFALRQRLPLWRAKL